MPPRTILVLTPLLLADTGASGGDVSALGFLKALAQHHTLHVIAFDESPTSEDSRRTLAEMHRWAASVRALPHPLSLTQRLYAKLRALALVPKPVTRHAAPEFRRAIREVLAAQPIDLVVAQFPKMAQYADCFPGLPSILDVQDAFTVSTFRDIAAARTLPARLGAIRTWLSWLLYEYRLFRPSLRTTVLPRLLPLAPSAHIGSTPTHHIGFIGSFKHPPNLLALEFLFDQILPQLTLLVPDLRVLIAGRHVPASLAARAPACVEFAGFIPTVEEFYSRIRIVVAPQVTGGGVKIKVIEGLFSGRPVVTTSIGAEGIDLTDNLTARIADEPAPFAAAVAALLHNPLAASTLGAAGQAHASALNSPARHAALVEAVFASLLPSPSEALLKPSNTHAPHPEPEPEPATTLP
jgi:glycosyltransferase involved in cell wall biosynthesis